MRREIYAIMLMILVSVNSQPVDEICKLPDFSYNKSLLYSGYLVIPSSNKGKKLHYLLVESQDGKIPMHLRDGLRIHNSDTNNVTYWIINCDSEDVSVKNPNIRVKLEKYDQKPEGYETVSDE